MKIRNWCVVSRGVFLLLFLAVLQSAYAEPIAVVNPSFEDQIEPYWIGQSWNWNDQKATGIGVIAGWNYDFDAQPWPSAYDTGVWDGVRDGVIPIDGEFLAYISGGSASGPWQNLGVPIIAGGKYTFTMAIQRRQSATASRLMFNYHDGAIRTLIDANDVDLTVLENNQWSYFSVSFTAPADAPYIGKDLGIEFNDTSGGTWVHFDAVSVDGPQMYVFNPSPANGSSAGVGTNLTWQVVNPTWKLDLYFGTDPNVGDNPKVIANQTGVTSYDPPGNLTNDTQYYWRVDVYEPNSIPGGNPSLRPGPRWRFNTIAATAKITKNPSAQTVPVGTNVQLIVEATSAETYQWYKDDVLLTDNGIFSGSGTATLTIKNMQSALTHEGFYHCVANNTLNVPAVSKKAQVLTQRMVARWTFDQTLADTEQGFTGVFTRATSTTDPNYAAGIAGDALNIPGDGRYVSINNSADYFNFYPRGFTVVAWVKTSSKTAWTGIVNKFFPGDFNNPAIGWRIFTDGTVGTFTVRTSVANTLSSTSTITDGAWHMVLGQYDPAAKVIRLYIDGNLQAQSNPIKNPRFPTTDRPLLIGSLGVEDPVELATALVDDVRLYSYSLTLNQIAELYYSITAQPVCLSNPSQDISGPAGAPDCIVNMFDFIALAQTWLECGRIPTSSCN